MKIIKWEQLPQEMQTEEVRKYYDILKKKKVSLFFKRGNFRLLLTEGPQDPNACQILPGGRGNAVQLSLDPAVHGHGDQHNAKHDQTQHRNHAGKYRRCLYIDGKGHDHGTKHHKGGPEQQPQCQIHTVLNLVDI